MGALSKHLTRCQFCYISTLSDQLGLCPQLNGVRYQLTSGLVCVHLPRPNGVPNLWFKSLVFGQRSQSYSLKDTHSFTSLFNGWKGLTFWLPLSQPPTLLRTSCSVSESNRLGITQCHCDNGLPGSNPTPRHIILIKNILVL